MAVQGNKQLYKELKNCGSKGEYFAAKCRCKKAVYRKREAQESLVNRLRNPYCMQESFKLVQ